MDNVETAGSSEPAQRAIRAREAGRWYARYLVVFAVASVIFAGGFGVVGNRWGVFVLTPAWAVFIAILTIRAQQKKGALVGMGRLHAWVIGVWTVLWAGTVIVGSLAFQGRVGWWLAGGVAMAVPCLVGVWVAQRRTT